MSLELAIKENTAAVQMLAELMTKLTSGAMQVATRTTGSADTAQVKAETKTEAKTTKVESKAESKPAAAATAKPESSTEPVTYEDVKKAILAFQQANGREATLATLKEFGAAKGTDLKPEQFAEALAKFTA